MPTIYWREIKPQSVQNGVPGNTDAYPSLMQNHEWVEAQYRPPIMAAVVTAADGSSLPVTASSYTEHLRFVVPQNMFDKDIEIRLLVKVSAMRFYLKAECSSGGSDTVVSTATSATWETLTVTPTSGSHPRTITISAYVRSGETGYIEAVDCSLKKSAFTREHQPAAFTSKWASVPYSVWNVDKMPIQSELIGRMLMGPSQIMADRPACLVAFIDDAQAATSRAAYATNSTTTTSVVAKFLMPNSDIDVRTYRASLYVDKTGTATVKTFVSLGGITAESTSTGWVHHTFTVSTSDAVSGSVGAIVTGGTGYVIVRSFQIMRE